MKREIYILHTFAIIVILAVVTGCHSSTKPQVSEKKSNIATITPGYYFKLCSKNDGGWIGANRAATAQSPEQGAIDFSKAQDPGYFPVPGKLFTSPLYFPMKIVNTGINSVEFHFTRWRTGGDPVGPPDNDHPHGRNYAHQALFKIIYLTNTGDEVDVTPTIQYKATWYADDLKLTLVFNTKLSTTDQLTANTTIYNSWLNDRHQSFPPTSGCDEKKLATSFKK